MDFGGGAAGHYKTLIDNISGKELTYNIIENPSMITKFREHMSEDDNVNYYTSIEDYQGGIDVDVAYTNASPSNGKSSQKLLML